MFYTDNPVLDAERYADEQEEELERLPVCEYCCKHIQDDYFYEINGEVICEDCLKECFRKDVEDYVG